MSSRLLEPSVQEIPRTYPIQEQLRPHRPSRRRTPRRLLDEVLDRPEAKA
jgi:hypothetical protein